MGLLLMGICVLLISKIMSPFASLSRQEKSWNALKKKMIESD